MAGKLLLKFSLLSQPAIHVLVIAPYRFLPAINGGHKAIERLYRHLGDVANVTVVSVKSNDGSYAKAFRLYKLLSDSPLHYISPFVFFSLRNIIRQEHITHVITEHPYMGWLGFLLQKTMRVSWIMRSHNIEAMRFKTLKKSWWKAMWQYEKWVCGKANAVFFITEEDKAWARRNYLLHEEKGKVITYGTDTKQAPLVNERKEAGRIIRQQYGIPSSDRVLMFNGDLGYEPNAQAVQIIIEQIYPLLQSSGFSYTVLVCGRNLENHFQKQIQNTGGRIIYAGFVEDIRQIFLAADIFINPVVSGGGIKTKLVEALSYGCSAVSTVSGATGIPHSVAGSKLTIVPDNDWTAFVKAIAEANADSAISNEFYGYFYWGNIARKALSALQTLH